MAPLNTLTVLVRLVLLLGLTGCTSLQPPAVNRFADTGVRVGETISIALRSYEACTILTARYAAEKDEECEESTSEGRQNEFEGCVASAVRAEAPGVAIIPASKLRPVSFPEQSLYSPHDTEEWTPLLEDGEFRQRLEPFGLRYLIVLDAQTRSSRGQVAGGAGAIGVAWKRTSSINAAILDFKETRQSGTLSVSAKGETAVGVIFVIAPIYYSNATESAACDAIGKAIAQFILHNDSK